MNNKIFRYLMSNDPEKVISQKGIKNRKIINPIFNLMLKLLNPYKRHIERKAELPKDKPTIFVASHGFRDDILNSLLTINDSVYVLFGVIEQFFRTIDGFKLWLCGVFLVDRDNKASKAAAKPKMVRAGKLGANTIDFFEATWNLSDNLLVAKPHLGIYDVAELTKIEVAPLTTHVEIRKFRSRCHSILGERYDLTKMTNERALETISLMTNSLAKVSDLQIYQDANSIVIREKANRLLKVISDGINSESNSNLEYLNSLIDLISKEASEIRKMIEQQTSEEDDEYTDMDEITKSIMKRSIDLLRVVMYAKKIIAVNELRDMIASHKYELMEKYSNYSAISRGKLEKKETLREQWEKYKRKLIKQVKYFNPEKEQTYLYKDPTEYSEEEVFGVLDDTAVTNDNAYVLSKSRNCIR